MAACSNQAQLFEDSNDGGWFAKPIGVLKPEWTRTAPPVAIDLGPRGPVAPEDLINTDGSCAPKAVEAPTAPAAAAATGGTASTANAPAAAPGPNNGGSTVPPPPLAPSGAGSTPAALGGIALGISECEAVRRAGAPNNVSIGTGEKSERRVVLTYVGGSWPGIYTFSAGRLKVVDAVPEPEKPKKPPVKKTPKRAKTAAQVTRMSVQ